MKEDIEFCLFPTLTNRKRIRLDLVDVVDVAIYTFTRIFVGSSISINYKLGETLLPAVCPSKL